MALYKSGGAMKKFKATICGGLSCLVVLGIGISSFSHRTPVLAAETGEYPWADALLLNRYTYDWGYTDCQPAMVQADACEYHNGYKDGQLHYESDPWRYDVRNCTSYVAWRVNHEFGIDIPGWGDARDWDQSAQTAGYEVDASPRIGDVAVWEGYYGHVAYVSEVNADGSVNVDQYNRVGTGEFSRESRVRAPKYIHVAPVKPAEPSTKPGVPASAPTTQEGVKEQGQPVAALRDTLVPLPTALTENGPLASTPESNYEVVRDPQSGNVMVYEIRFSGTATGRVELSISNLEDGNTTWKQTWATSEMSHGANEMAYNLADYNADGILDLYQVKYAHSTSNQTEVRVMDGAKGYTSLLGSWGTIEPTQQTAKAAYKIADYDGDGSLDMYKISAPEPDAKRIITVLSGAKNFTEQVGHWETEVPTTGDIYFTLGDDDRDGQIDLYQQSQTEQELQPKTEVFTAASGYKQPFRSWTNNDEEFLSEH